jgi:hypothetical protein
MAIIAYSFPAASRTKVANFPVHALAREGVERALTRPLPLPEHSSAFILTDDYNPIDFFDSAMKEDVRRDILKSTDWDILI